MVDVVDRVTDYPNTPQVRSHTPPKKLAFGKYRDCLRLEFRFTCVYCLSKETEIVLRVRYGGFEIEHFKPKGNRTYRRFINDYKNLLWSCGACNRAKGEKWPTEDDIEQGMFFVDPTKEALGNNLCIEGFHVEAITPAGDYMIDELDLNSDVHVGRREDRQDRIKALEAVRTLLDIARRNSAAPESDPKIIAIAKECDSLQQACGLGAPWDAPNSCACDGFRPKQRRRLTKRQRKEKRRRKWSKRRS